MTAQKHSRQRSAIIEYLKQTKEHPTADTVYEEIRRSFPHISLGTVYRNLSLLSENGQILKLSIQGQPDRFDYRTDDHSHMLCRKCGRVVDLEISFPELDRIAKENFSGSIDGHICYFYGKCPACEKTASEEA